MNTIIGNYWDLNSIEQNTLLDLSCLYTDIYFQERFMRLKKCVFPITQEQYKTAVLNDTFSLGNETGDVQVDLYASYKNLGPAIRIEFPKGGITKLSPISLGKFAYTVDLSKPYAAGNIGLLALYAYNHISLGNSRNTQIHTQNTISNVLDSKESVPNSTPFRAIGDLDGSYKNFKRLALQYGIMNSQGNWGGGNDTAIFMGDIVADRVPEGFMILRKIQELRMQAKAQGGKIVTLAGNHEEFLLGYLTGTYANLVNSVNTQYYHSKGIACLDELELFCTVYDQKNMLRNMQQHPIGNEYLSYLIDFELCHIVGNNLFFHTPPTTKMIQMINGSEGVHAGVTRINQEWNQCLRKLLLESCKLESTRTLYFQLAKIFLNTRNDTFSGILSRIGEDSTSERVSEIQEKFAENIATNNSSLYESLQKQGIDSIIHGHTSTQMTPVPGMKFYTINRTGMLCK